MGWSLLPLLLILFILPGSITQEVEETQKEDLNEIAKKLLKSQSEVDFNEGIKILKERSEKDDEEALYLLGSAYENFSAAMEYYNRSAALGSADALQALGFLWGTGKTGIVNEPLVLLRCDLVSLNPSLVGYSPQSLLYYAFAAQGKNPAAMMTLGYKYLHGYGVPKACPKAAQRYEAVASAVVALEEQTSRPAGRDPVRLSGEGKDREKAEADIVEYYLYSALAGDPAAQVTMGTLYLRGRHGVPQDYQEARRFFQLAADQGDAGGLSHLGFMLANGLDSPQDNSSALQLYRRAADQGHPHAQTQLGFMTLHGYGVTANAKEAFKWFKLAAEQGYAEALVNLGLLYLNGVGTPKSPREALGCFSLAAQQGHLRGIFYLAQLHHYGEGTPPSCQLAVQLYKRVAEKGPWEQLLHSAYEEYRNGNIASALLQYERAAVMGYEVAQSNVWWLYHSGQVPVSQEAQWAGALEYLRPAAEQNNAEAAVQLGDYYFWGRATPQDYERAALFYSAAADLRSPQGRFNLGYMHQYGLGLPRDLHLAKRHYDATLVLEPEAFLAVWVMLGLLGLQFASEWSPAQALSSLPLDSLVMVLVTLLLLFLLFLRTRV